MADDFQDKTEDASQKKLTDARSKGQVAKSQDLTASAILCAGMLTLLAFSGFIYRMLSSIMEAVFMHLSLRYDQPAMVVYWFKQGLGYTLMTVLPILIVVFVMALLINISQVKLVFSVHPLIPKWQNLNIFSPKRYKKFFELSAIMRLVFGLSKLTVVGVVCYFVMMGLLPEITRLIAASPKEFMLFLSKNTFFIGIIIALILIFLGLLDFMYQQWKFAKDQKMTKQEVKEERKQTEGDVHVKSKMRSMMQSFAQSRMKANVPQSDVIIANPIHYAIAIKYDPETMAAPRCLAKGARKMALAIKDIARENKVPIVENPPLARSMYKVVDVGQQIPQHYYHAVAEVLAFVYRLNEKMGKKKFGIEEALEIPDLDPELETAEKE